MPRAEEIDTKGLFAAIQNDWLTLSNLLDRAVSKLMGALEIARDAGITSGPTDRPSLDVPSISEHEQNEHGGDFSALVRFLDFLWQRLSSIDADIARTQAERLS